MLARNDETGALEYRLVQARFVHRDGNITRLTLRDRATGATQTLVTTANHPFYVADAVMPEVRLVANGGIPVEAGTIASGRWVEAGSLNRGERLLNEHGGTSEVVAVTVEDTEQDAYNLTVEEFHTFFVASPDNDNAPAVWVHNACRLGDFTRGQRQEAIDSNRAAGDGMNHCQNCGQEVVRVGNSKGVTPPGNQLQVHHEPPINQGGGRDSERVILCRDCHIDHHR